MNVYLCVTEYISLCMEVILITLPCMVQTSPREYVFRWMGKIRMKTLWGNAHMLGHRYTQNFTFSCENVICAFIGSVGTYD